MTTETLPTVKAVVIQLPVFQREIAIPAEWLAKRDALIAESVAIATVTTKAEYDRATAVLAAITSEDNGIEKKRLAFTKPFSDAAKEIKAKVDEACQGLRDNKTRLKAISGDWYMKDQARIRREAAEADRIERERIEAELAKAQAEADAAEALGFDAVTPPVIEERPTPVELAPTNAHTRVPMRVSFELVDEAKVPRSFMMFDPRKANEYIRLNKEDIQKRVENGEADGIVAGLRFTVRPDVQGRG